MPLTRVLLWLGMIVGLSRSAAAYEIVPIKQAETLLHKHGIHEAMTLASVACEAEGSADIKRCKQPTLETLWSQWRDGGKLSASDFVRELVEGVRWPDDPLRVVHQLSTVGKANLLFSDCKRWIKGKKFGVCTNRFCQSHFGSLQMLHAMNPGGMTQQQVQERIFLWAQLMYRLASRELPDSALVSAEAAGLFPCEECPLIYEGSTLREVLHAHCNTLRNMTSIKRCPTYAGGDSAHIALGALLHLIQDSYSRAHVARPTTNFDCSTPAIVCAPVLVYQDYWHQVPKLHSQADGWPAWDPSCSAADSAVHDPVTAGAWILRALKTRAQWAVVERYLKEHVFLTAPPRTPPQDVSCFAKGS